MVSDDPYLYVFHPSFPVKMIFITSFSKLIGKDENNFNVFLCIQVLFLFLTKKIAPY
jgi:hypothetical protein